MAMGDRHREEEDGFAGDTEGSRQQTGVQRRRSILNTVSRGPSVVWSHGSSCLSSTLAAERSETATSRSNLRPPDPELQSWGEASTHSGHPCDTVESPSSLTRVACQSPELLHAAMFPPCFSRAGCGRGLPTCLCLWLEGRHLFYHLSVAVTINLSANFWIML